MEIKKINRRKWMIKEDRNTSIQNPNCTPIGNKENLTHFYLLFDSFLLIFNYKRGILQEEIVGFKKHLYQESNQINYIHNNTK